MRTFWHIHVLDRLFPVELSVYAPSERRIQGRSSTDGTRIDRVSIGRLRARLEDESPRAYGQWRRTGALEWEEPEVPPGDFDGLLLELDAMAPTHTTGQRGLIRSAGSEWPPRRPG